MKKQLDTVLLKESINIIMSDVILNKIKFLCKSIAKVEWSGILFYSIDGTIKEPEKMTVHLQDILPMDKGSSAFTEYILGDAYIDFLMKDEKRTDWHVGHIHSHNTMGVFFSGTDMEELEDNSEAHNIYLSLIVNNYMDFKAKIAFRAKVQSQITEIPYIASDENGEEYTVDTATFDITKEKLYTYDCTINSKQENITVDEEFSKRVDEIMKPPVVVPPKQIGYNKHKAKKHKSQQKKSFGEFLNGIWQPASNKFTNNTEWTNTVSPEELFMLSLFTFSDEVFDDDTLDDLLDGLSDIGLRGPDVADIVMKSYIERFERHFPLGDQEGNLFISVTDKVIMLLEEQQNMYPVLDDTIDALNVMIIKFKEYDTTKRNV